MSIFLEPVYLNEKMVLNCAAYLFKGVALESEVKEENLKTGKGSLNLGFKFLQDFISPLSGSAEIAKNVKNETTTARRYTLGGLHMTVLDELEKSNHIKYINELTEDFEESYVDIEVILKPIDFFSLIETIKAIAPLLFQILKNFGSKMNQDIFTDKFKKELENYEIVLAKIVEQLETDYLQSKQIEMIMVDPQNTSIQLGIVDLDVTDYDPNEIKARLTDGKFHIIGKVTRHIVDEENLSLVQRTFLSSVVDIVTKLVDISDKMDAITQYRSGLNTIRPIIEQICQLQIKGPAYRIMAMSVCV